MSKDSAQTEKPIPAWVFILVLSICIGGLGLLQFSRQAKRRAGPVISEIQALNQTGMRDREGELTDWIEIWNPTDQPLELDGYFLTDDIRDLRKWRIPKRTLKAKRFLVVFASGKNIASEYGELHASFRLNPEGEYLAIIAPNGERIVHQFLPKYEKQYGDISFGIKPEIFTQTKVQLSGRSRDMSYLRVPTPGLPNQIEMLGMVADVKFSEKRGYLLSPTNVVLTVTTPSADIRYTIDGSAPSETNGVVYTGPISIDRTTVLRAAAHRPGFRTSKIGSHTFIFQEQVVRGLSSKLEGAEFERAINGLREIPSISLLIPPRTGAGLYGKDDATPVSMELIDPATGKTKQVDCGLKQLSSGINRPARTQKEDFQLIFDRQFGDSDLKHELFGRKKPRVFHGLRIFGGSNGSTTNGYLEHLISDSWIRSTLLDLGNRTARYRFVHLYDNGHYEGVYTLAELTEATFVPTKSGSTESDYDVRNGLEQLAGDSVAWNELLDGLNVREANTATFKRLTRNLDLAAFIDFTLVQLYTGVSDLDRDGNWMAVRSRKKNGGTFKFLFTGNNEPMLNWSINQIGLDDIHSPARLFQVLRRDDQFSSAFSERARQLLGVGGELSPRSSLDRYEYLMGTIDDSEILETLRWSDQSRKGLKEFFEKRPDEFKKQLESAGLWK